MVAFNVAVMTHTPPPTALNQLPQLESWLSPLQSVWKAPILCSIQMADNSALAGPSTKDAPLPPTARMPMPAASTSGLIIVQPDAWSGQQQVADPHRVVIRLVPAKIKVALCKYGILSNWIHILYSISSGFDVSVKTVPPHTIIFWKTMHHAIPTPASYHNTSKTSRWQAGTPRLLPRRAQELDRPISNLATEPDPQARVK